MRRIALLLLLAAFSCSDSYERTATNYLWSSYAPETRDLLLFLENTSGQEGLTKDQELELEDLYVKWTLSVPLVQPNTEAVTGAANPLEIIDLHKRGHNRLNGRYGSLMSELRDYPETVSFLANNRSILRVAILGEDLGLTGQRVAQRIAEKVEAIQEVEAAYFDLFNYSPELLSAYEELNLDNPASLHPIPLLILLKSSRSLLELLNKSIDEAELEGMMNMLMQQRKSAVNQFYSSLEGGWYPKVVSFEVVQALGNGEYEIELLGERCILLANTVEYTTVGKAALPILSNGNVREGKTTRGFRREYAEFIEVSPEEYWDRMTEIMLHRSFLGKRGPMLNELDEKKSAFNAKCLKIGLDF
jgi:hypothetical protein